MSEQTNAPRILLIGATGPTGRAVLASAARRGLPIRALARNPAALADLPPLHTVVKGDVLDPASLAAATAGIDAVICSLGTREVFGPVTVLSQGTADLVAAMRAAGATRLVVVTGMGAGDSRGHGGFLYDRIVLPLLLKRIYADKDRQEAVVRASGLDWTIVRPGWLTDGPAAGRFRVVTDLAGVRLGSIARADVADFLLAEASSRDHVGGVVHLTD